MIIIVHNYSSNEASFHNNQYLILEKVIKYYDKVLIYSGHNEIYPFLIDKKICKFTRWKHNRV